MLDKTETGQGSIALSTVELILKKTVFITALILSACLEAQPAPEVTERPSTDFNIEVVWDRLTKPWAVEPLPNGDYVVTEIGGTAKRITGSGASEISGLPDDILVYGQGGLLDVALWPDYGESGEIFLSYTYGSKEANGTALYRAALDGTTLRNGEVIYKATAKPAGSHYGGKIDFLPDGTLILTLGDGFALREEAQNLDNSLGKIVRLNRDGSPADYNPFPDKGAPEIYSWGHRNVQGLAYDSETGYLWAHEHGPRGGDELNLIKKGANYGWPIATTGRDYNGARISPFESYEGMEPYIYQWTPSIAPSGLTIYRGDMFPEWNGDALVGALANRSLWRIDLDETKVVGEERLLGDLDSRVRDVVTDRDGAVLVLTESDNGGQLLRLTPK